MLVGTWFRMPTYKIVCALFEIPFTPFHGEAAYVVLYFAFRGCGVHVSNLYFLLNLGFPYPHVNHVDVVHMLWFASCHWEGFFACFEICCNWHSRLAFFLCIILLHGYCTVHFLPPITLCGLQTKALDERGCKDKKSKGNIRLL